MLLSAHNFIISLSINYLWVLWALSNHLWVQYLAQGYLGSPLKVFWHLALLSEHACTGARTDNPSDPSSLQTEPPPPCIGPCGEVPTHPGVDAAFAQCLPSLQARRG